MSNAMSLRATPLRLSAPAPAPAEVDAARPVDAAAAPRPAEASHSGGRSFLRMVSHELRTPLNAIIGFSEIISSELCGPLPKQYKEYGEIIRVSGHRLLKLVNQALDIVKLESGSMELDPRAEPLDALFVEVKNAAAEEWQARGMRFEIDLPSPVPAALADARALRSALGNLVQNAVAFGREGGVVRLAARVCGPLVQLQVIDDGEGLDPAQTPRLMQPFEQGENALVRRVEGAGLGWPLVSLLCRAMGGTFEVDTAPGEGLCATITLRRAG